VIPRLHAFGDGRLENGVAEPDDRERSEDIKILKFEVRTFFLKTLANVLHIRLTKASVNKQDEFHAGPFLVPQPPISA
jgi:hypothetical protein